MRTLHLDFENVSEFGVLNYVDNFQINLPKFKIDCIVAQGIIKSFAIFMMLSGIIGVIFGLIWQKITKDKTFPFAPALSISLMASLLLSDLSPIL